MALLVWIENAPLSEWVRNSDSLFAYSGILFLHTFGLAALVGMNIVVDLSILRRPAGQTITPLLGLYRYMWLGFWINAASGTLLLMADATTKLANPVFYVKIACVGLGVLTMVMMRRRLERDAAEGPVRGLTGLAVASLLIWACAITAGRLMAYLGPVSGAPGLTN